MNWFAKLLVQLLIAGSAFEKKPEPVISECPLLINIETLNKNERERIELEYRNQQKCIVAIFVIGVTVSFGIIYLLGAPKRIDAFVYGLNLTFKSLGLMITVFLAVVLLDAIYFANKGNDKSKNIKFEIAKITVYMFTFYMAIMFSNLRYWLKEIYVCQKYNIDLANQIEKWLGIIAVIALGISFLFAVITRIIKKTEYGDS